MEFNSNIPIGALQEKWDNHRFSLKLVNPANKRKYKVIVVGSGLAGSSVAASLAEIGYDVDCFCFQDSPRRAHSIAAQGGINAAKNYQNDGDSIFRLFYDTIKGGDYRAREANVYRLAQISGNIIDQCVAQGVPFARDYAGYLDNRSFGGAQVSRTFYAKGQTGQQLLLGAYASLNRQIHLGKVTMYSRHEMLDVILVNGHAKGIVARNLETGQITSFPANAVVLATGGYGNVYFLSTNAKGSNVTASWRAHKKGAYMANPCFAQIHPTCIPVSGDYQSKLTLMSESLRNDGRVWVPKQKNDSRSPDQIPASERNYYLEERYPSFGNLVPRDVASRAAKEICDAGFGMGEIGNAVYLDFQDAIARLGNVAIEQKYGNLFQMYEKIIGDNPYKTPMKIYPAVHYVMGGLWVDYNLMTSIPGLFALGECNFSDHGANRLGASALMQGLADGYFIAPYTISNYLANDGGDLPNGEGALYKETERKAYDKLKRLLAIQGKQTVDQIHRKLGKIMWDHCGMSRTETKLKEALSLVEEIRDDFWQDLRVPGELNSFNQSLEKANRLSDFIDLASLMIQDALERKESCGAHFRAEYQTADHEAQRNDKDFCYVAAWEYKTGGGDKKIEHVMHRENLEFENVHLSTRSYK